MESTNILNKLWKNANEGFMVVGDDDVLKVLAQAIQPKDRQIFIDFYSALRNAYNELDFLALLKQDERPRLFEPALNISNSGNDLAQAAERYCSFIDKTNDRISSIRQQIN